ncbi:hypothetical protein Lal_00023855 [Lupinus albus]|nr:hypothetical protein Lal_00023855 [Lupinus albus]
MPSMASPIFITSFHTNTAFPLSHTISTPIHIITAPLSKLRCCGNSSNGKGMNRTILHDLYEKHRQSPYYDNLCRPVSDLVPFIAKGIRVQDGLLFQIFERSISSSNAYNEQLR